MKFETYKGEILYDVLVTRKIDGVRAHKTDTGIVSRSGKPLYNLEMSCEIAEIFCGSWEKTISATRTHNGPLVDSSSVYSLLPEVDKRLVVGRFDIITPEIVNKLFQEAVSLGYEGLVLQANARLYKVKGKETFDVPIIGILPGKGRHLGRMGALLTPMGRVGTGFTDTLRERSWKEGEIIEVDCMELTPDGKFRHPRFIRLREDK